VVFSEDPVKPRNLPTAYAEMPVWPRKIVSRLWSQAGALKLQD